MKPFALLIVGVVVGWAASGLDWNRSAVGEEPAKPASKSTDGVLTFELSDKPVDAPVSNGIPRSAGNPEDLDPLQLPAVKFSEPLFDSAPVSTNAANSEPLPTKRDTDVGRYQISAYGMQSSTGAYAIDTATGRVWHIWSGGAVIVANDLPEK